MTRLERLPAAAPLTSLVYAALLTLLSVWTSPHDPCYHPDGRPRHCLSEFINAAYGVPVDANLHNPNNLTCWMAHAGHDTGDWVLTLPLGRRFEITYISLQFCNQEEPPDPISLSILKSMDYGRSWRNNNLNTRPGVRNLQVVQPLTFVSPVQPPLAISDLQVGGRCKCNGHASRCRRDDTGRAVCVCEHHTAGPDCDVCADFYVDRPWHRATPTHPNPCVACECNGHSNKCRFSMEVFLQSGRKSGGVCQKCRHNTAGRHCQYCQNGYTRDHSKALSHRKACQPCQCHPVGAVGRWCNQTSGQCLCRDGVTGLRCNRCAPGYKQGKSPLRPCIRKPSYTATMYNLPVAYCQDLQLNSKNKETIELTAVCVCLVVLKVQVKGMERSGPWWQFSISVQVVFRTRSPSRVRRGPQSLWVPNRDLACGCPALHVGRTFLLIGAEDGERGWGPEESRLVADRSTLALQWREHWSPKLRAFRGQDKRGRCPSKSEHGKPNADPQPGYVPPHLRGESEANAHSAEGTETPPTSSAASPVCSTPNA
uniref:Netrin 5 n=1 Tax=Oryzias melastigma TaxID=30732 RepID=A0A3B3C0X2_ORYME